MKRSKKALAFWVAPFAVYGTVDYVLSISDDPEIRYLTLSNTGRSWVCVGLVGEAAFVTGWGLLTYWLLPHIVGPARAARMARRAGDAVSTAVSGSLAAAKE